MNGAKFMKPSKASQCKFYHPMLFLYTWIVIDFASNIIRNTWIFTIEKKRLALLLYLPTTMKVMIGVEQIWLMIELIM